MDALQQLNKLGAQAGLETRRLKDLPVNQPFPVENLQRIETRFGSRIVCQCQEFLVFLPSRFASISDEALTALNSRSLVMKYLGMQNNACLINFEEEEAV